MGVKSVSVDSSDRESWGKIFKTLVKILQTKQDLVESLLKDRKIIEDTLKTKHDNWIYVARNYEERLSLKNREIETMKMMQFVETSKCNLLSGLKEMDLSLCNLKLEPVVDELNDFKAWFDFLTLNTIMQKENGNSEAADSKSLEAELRKVKLEYEKLASKKKCEVSNLLRENGFAWRQFKCIESGFTDKLQRKDDEIDQANTKISSLISYQEQLQSSNHEKDEVISRLKAKVAEMETNATKKDEEILKLSRDVESLKKSRSHQEQLQSSDHEKDDVISRLKAKVAEMETNATKKDEEISKLSRDVESLKKSRSFTPILTRCTTTHDKGSNRNTVGFHISTKKEKSAASTPNEKEIKSSKRKRANKTPVSVSEIPKLFTSTFRVPKLKSPSSGAI